MLVHHFLFKNNFARGATSKGSKSNFNRRSRRGLLEGSSNLTIIMRFWESEAVNIISSGHRLISTSWRQGSLFNPGIVRFRDS